MERILELQEMQQTLQWPVGAHRDIKVNPVLVHSGYRVIRLGDQVSLTDETHYTLN